MKDIKAHLVTAIVVLAIGLCVYAAFAKPQPVTAQVTEQGTTAGTNEVYPDLSCKVGLHQQIGFTAHGHAVTITAKGGWLNIDMDGWLSNVEDACASDADGYGYTVIEFYPPVSDGYLDTFYGNNVLTCWPNYVTVGTSRGRLQTGPGIIGSEPYLGSQVYSLGYNGQPVFATCWVSGEEKFKFGYKQ